MTTRTIPHTSRPLPAEAIAFVAPVKEHAAGEPDFAAPEQPVVPARERWTLKSLAPGVAAVLVAGALTTFFVSTRFKRDALEADRRLWQLTTSGGLESEPSWAPDSQRIAYSSDRSGNFDIWTQSTSDDHAVKLTSSTADDWQPSWSPDGRQIAFRSERDDGGIFVVPAAGGEERRITRFGYKPQWSRVGSTLLFYYSNVVSKLYIVEGSGSNLRRVLTDFLRRLAHFERRGIPTVSGSPFTATTNITDGLFGPSRPMAEPRFARVSPQRCSAA